VDLTVATWNLQGRDPSGVGMAGVVERFRPDVLLLQEADGRTLDGFTPLRDLAHRLLRADAGYTPGMAILSRFPVLQAGAMADPSRDGNRPPLIWARLTLRGAGELVVASVHASAPVGSPWTDNPWHRRVDLLAIRAFAGELRASGTPTVLGGDCNTVRYAITGYHDVGASAPSAAPTWRPLGGLPWLPALVRLDRIYASPEFQVMEVATACRSSWSDHCPVVARLRWQDPSSSTRNIT
jgi:endonuclease/exonuclease/phosphatase family metal-dependent hydrolase